MVDSRLCFHLVLPTQPEEGIEQVRGVLCEVNNLDCPYVVLKARLLQLLNPKPEDRSLKLIFGGDLGNRRPSQLMETMLALLLPREGGRHPVQDTVRDQAAQRSQEPGAQLPQLQGDGRPG